jgi:hypothetical protein
MTVNQPTTTGVVTYSNDPTWWSAVTKGSARSSRVLDAAYWMRSPSDNFVVVFKVGARSSRSSVAHRVLGVSRSGYRDWRDHPPLTRQVADTRMGCATRP